MGSYLSSLCWLLWPSVKRILWCLTRPLNSCDTSANVCMAQLAELLVDLP